MASSLAGEEGADGFATLLGGEGAQPFSQGAYIESLQPFPQGDFMESLVSVAAPGKENTEKIDEGNALGNFWAQLGAAIGCGYSPHVPTQCISQLHPRMRPHVRSQCAGRRKP